MDTIQSLDIVLAFPSEVKPFIASRWHTNASRIPFFYSSMAGQTPLMYSMHGGS